MADGFLSKLGEVVGSIGPAAPGSPVQGGVLGPSVGPLVDLEFMQQWTTAVGAAVEGLGSVDGAEHASASADITVEAASDGAAVDGDVVDAYGEPDVVDDAGPADITADDPAATGE